MKLSESIRSRLSSQHLGIAGLISGAEKERLHVHPAPGKWSIHDNMAHLARYNIVFQDRMKTIVGENSPRFDRYVAEDDAEFPSWQEMKTDELLDSIFAERKKISEQASGFSESELSRVGIHPRFGNLSLAGWLDFFLLHEAHHMFTIFQLRNDVTLKS